MKAAFAAAKKVAVLGPADIPLVDQATLHISDKFVFIPAKESKQIMTAMGNGSLDNLLGLLFPTSDADTDAFVAVEYIKSGYIKDDDAKDWNADELLTSVKEGTDESNKDRRARGMPELEVVGWVERPRYDPATHQLKWSVSSKHKGDSEAQGINYNTYALGREGYINMNLVTDLKSVEGQKPLAAELLSGLKFSSGKAYSDFNSSTDKVAEYGLAALIGGVAAKKLGLLALIGVFFAKFFKIIVIGGIAAVAGIFKLRKKKETQVAAALSPAQAATPPAGPTDAANPNKSP